MNDHFSRFRSHFNARRYRDALLAAEDCWFADRAPARRNEFYQGLIQLCCALNQMQLGHASGPIFLLARARKRLIPFAPRHHQLNVARIITFIEHCERLVSEDGNRVEPPKFILRRLNPEAERKKAEKEKPLDRGRGASVEAIDQVTQRP